LDSGGCGALSAVVQGAESNAGEGLLGWDEVAVGVTAVLLGRRYGQFFLAIVFSL